MPTDQTPQSAPSTDLTESVDKTSQSAPSEQDIARICDWWCDTAVEARLSIPEMREAARDALNALRSAPVAERMEAMGMEPVGLAHQTCPIECVHYGESDRG